MPSNPVLAREEVFELFTLKFKPLAVPCAITYQGKVTKEKPRSYWVHLSMTQVTSGQSGFVLTDDETESPASFETSGLIQVQVFAPLSAEDSFHNGDLLAQRATDIFRGAGTASGVWFRNARYNELPFRPNDAEYRWNVVVEYEFDEFK
jgi:hypothetical protein